MLREVVVVDKSAVAAPVWMTAPSLSAVALAKAGSIQTGEDEFWLGKPQSIGTFLKEETSSGAVADKICRLAKVWSFATLGEGPLVVMLHGFPDFWYTWRDQMDALSSDFKVVAIDLRGYNLSDQPEGVDRYSMPLLVGDVAAVIRHHGAKKAVVVGHDWGGAIAWNFTLNMPEMTDKLVILNLPHPNGLVRELHNNPKLFENSAYARAFQEKETSAPDVFFGYPMTPGALSAWVIDPVARRRYIEAFERSDFTAMLNYYKANYPRIEPGSKQKRHCSYQR